MTDRTPVRRTCTDSQADEVGREDGSSAPPFHKPQETEIAIAFLQ